MKVFNKVMVVTGAGGEIGREFVFQILERGAKVAAISSVIPSTSRNWAPLADVNARSASGPSLVVRIGKNLNKKSLTSLS